MAAVVRGLVSKKKLRYTEDGFDLDLTYINDQIIAMGFPSSGAEARYRNPMPEVQRLLNGKHAGHYKVYNLCSERSYPPESFERCDVSNFNFHDHNPPPLEMVARFCEDVHAFLTADPKNVVAIHCKAGKGRTGMVISAYLVHTRKYTAEEALQFFGDRRTSNGKGVTIPSQMRYVHYYEQMLLHGPERFPTKKYKVMHIRLISVPNFDVGGGCDPYFVVRNQAKQKLYNYKEQVKKVAKFKSKQDYVDLPLDELPKSCVVEGDVDFIFFDHDQMSAPDKMFHFWFNTGFIHHNYLCFHKEVVDTACKDKKCSSFKSHFAVELFFQETTEDVTTAERIDEDVPLSDTDEDA